ncbi:MAG: alternative ribosome rescue aminoacyl-tRNA hydrolase ArfB [Sporichthyaceae bacterium]
MSTGSVEPGGTGGLLVGGVRIPEGELSWRFSRSSGPGGQSVNTTDSRVELVYDLAASSALPALWKQRALERLADRLVAGSIVVAASEHRSQLRNREAARERLAELLREATAPPPRARRPTKPSAGAKRRRLEDKSRRSSLKNLRRNLGD